MDYEEKITVRQEEPAFKLGTEINAFVVTFAMVKDAEIGTRWTREKTTSMGFSTPMYDAKVIDKDDILNEALIKITKDDDGKKTTELLLIKFL